MTYTRSKKECSEEDNLQQKAEVAVNLPLLEA